MHERIGQRVPVTHPLKVPGPVAKAHHHGQGVPSLAIACDRHLGACVTGGGLLVVDLSSHELPRWVMHKAITSDYLVIILRWFPCEGTVATIAVGRRGPDALSLIRTAGARCDG
jgi:hypothetical protein